MEDLGSWSWDLSNIHPNQIALCERQSLHWGSFSLTLCTNRRILLHFTNGKAALCHPYIDQDHFGEGHPQCGIIQLDDGRTIGPFPIPAHSRFEEEPITIKKMSEEQIKIAKEIQSKRPFGQGMLILSTNHPSFCSHVRLPSSSSIKGLSPPPPFQSKVPLKDLPMPSIHEPPFPNSFFPRQIHHDCIRSAHPMISESGHVNNPAMLHLIFRGLNQFFQTHHHLPSANQSVCILINTCSPSCAHTTQLLFREKLRNSFNWLNINSNSVILQELWLKRSTTIFWKDSTSWLGWLEWHGNHPSPLQTALLVDSLHMRCGNAQDNNLLFPINSSSMNSSISSIHPFGNRKTFNWERMRMHCGMFLDWESRRNLLHWTFLLMDSLLRMLNPFAVWPNLVLVIPTIMARYLSFQMRRESICIISHVSVILPNISYFLGFRLFGWGWSIRGEYLAGLVMVGDSFFKHLYLGVDAGCDEFILPWCWIGVSTTFIGKGERNAGWCPFHPDR